MTAYTIKHSDTSKPDINVPSMPPGINTVDTSLSLVGRGYPNYGEKIAQNFLNLLENFSAPTAPANAVEGQLWYNNTENILKISDGDTWFNVSSSYTSEPLTPKIGDSWFNTSDNILSIWNGSDWIPIGPSVSGTAKTGIEIYTMETSQDPPVQVPVVLTWSSGQVVSVTSSAEEFTARTYPAGMDFSGFPTIAKGITVKKISGQLGRIAAKADDALKLGGTSAVDYLKKVDPNVQTITSRFLFETPNAPNPDIRGDGIKIKVTGSLASDYVQIYQTRPADTNPGALVISNNSLGGKIIFKSNVSGSITNSAIIDGTNLTIAGGLTVSTPHTPSSASATGIRGQMSWDSNYVYVCVATNTWKRSALSTW